MMCMKRGVRRKVKLAVVEWELSEQTKLLLTANNSMCVCFLDDEIVCPLIFDFSRLLFLTSSTVCVFIWEFSREVNRINFLV